MQTLELDKKAQVDLFLLAHQGRAKRTEVNEILWNLLSNLALDPEYRGLSHFASASVGQARKRMGRPPWGHAGRPYWTWSNYTTIRNRSFDPL